MEVLQGLREEVGELWRCGAGYRAAVAVRVAAVLLPATGYIHPDEHFQSVEVVVGGALGLTTTSTWEWSTEQPLRSPTLSLLLYAPPALLLRLLLSLLHLPLSYPLLQAATRLPLLPLSLATDLSVLHLARHLHLPPRPCLLLLATSHLAVVHATRPLANSVELALTSLVLALTLVPRSPTSSTLPLGILCALGTFNRPTFIVFVGWALLAWFLRGVVNLASLRRALLHRLLPLCLATLLPALLILLTDSLYFGDLTATKLVTLTASPADWKATPLNFLLFNLTPGNAARFGEDPRLTHLLANLPLLFGPLALLPWLHPRVLRGGNRLLLLSLLSPLLLFSLVDHQEARFLLPLLPTMVLLLAPTATRLPWFLPLWLAFNLALGTFWGILNQGGLVPLLAAVPAAAAGRVEVVLPWAWPPPHLPLLATSSRFTLHPEVTDAERWEGGGLDTMEGVVASLNSLTCLPSSTTLLGLPSHLLPQIHALLREVEVEEVGRFWPHLSLESLLQSVPPPLSPTTVASSLLHLLTTPSHWIPPPGILTLSLLNVTRTKPCLSQT